MTKRITFLAIGFALGASLGWGGLVGLQSEGKQLESADLRSMVSNLGFAPKDLGDPAKGKFEITITKETLDVPVAAEISGSKRFIWLTAFLGETSKIKDFAARSVPLLQKNFDIQPSMFYVTAKGNLMMAICVENRDVTPSILRWRIDKLVSDVVATEKVWSSD